MSDDDRSLEECMNLILCELMTMNVLKAIAMSHDSLELSSREQDFVDAIASTPFEGEDDEE